MGSQTSSTRVRPLSRKVLGLSMAPVLFFLILIFGFIVPRVEQAILQGKRDSMRQVVELGVSTLQKMDAEVQAGRLSREQAQMNAQSLIGAMRFDKSNYLVVQDHEGSIKVHPRAELIGKASSDPVQVAIHKKWIEAIKNSEGGLVE